MDYTLSSLMRPHPNNGINLYGQPVGNFNTLPIQYPLTTDINLYGQSTGFNPTPTDLQATFASGVDALGRFGIGNTTPQPAFVPRASDYTPIPQVNNTSAGLGGVGQNNRNATWTGSDWANLATAGVQLMGSLGSLWMQNKGYKLAKQQMADQTALNRANYRMQAKAWNNSQRDIASGRGLAVMSSSQKSALGRQARGRLVEESY